MLDRWRADLVYAVRMAAKTPVVTAIAVVSLALGVSVNVLVFSLVSSWLLRPLPYPEAERLVIVSESNQTLSEDSDPVAPANFFDWRRRATSFDRWIASEFGVVNLTGRDQPRQLEIARVTPGFFQLLGGQPIRGRSFRRDEGGAEDPPVAVLSEGFWRQALGGDPGAVGESLLLDGEPHTVVGVMPETFDFLLGNVDLWLAADFLDRRESREERQLVVTARLAPGVSVMEAGAEMEAIAASLAEEHPETNERWGVTVESVREIFPGETDRGLTLVLMLVVFLALMVACANVATLMLAKTEARHRELAVRAALGASRRSLVRQLLTESVLLALGAGALGVLLGAWEVKGLAASLPSFIPSFFIPRPDAPVLAFGLVVSLLAGLTFGVTPALQARASDLRASLAEGGRGGTAGAGRRRLRGAFIVAQLAMALVILIGASVLTDAFNRSLRVDPGYDAGGLLTLELTVPEHRYADDDALVRFLDEVGRGFEALPGADRWALMSELPRTRALPVLTLTIDGKATERHEEPRASWLAVSPSYLETLRIALRAGRTFSDADRAGAPPVLMVNQRFAEHLFGGGAAVGRRVTIGGASREVVGVVPDVALTRLAGLEPIEPTVFFPLAQHPVRRLRAAIRTDGDPLALTEAARRTIWAVDPEQPITAVQSLEAFIEETLVGPTTIANLLYGVGLLTLVLAALGIYGVTAYAVAQQTTEIGVRMALGARRLHILQRITRQGGRLAGLGFLVGAPGAVAVVSFLLRLPADIPGVERWHLADSAMPIAAVCALLAGVTLAASLLPAGRAARIDPVVALRDG